MKKVLSIVSRALLIAFTFLFGAYTVANTILTVNEGTITSFLGQNYANKVKDETLGADEEFDSEYFKSEFKSVAEVKKSGEDFTQRVMEEGAVLLKNENNALPLGDNAKISLFSASSVKGNTVVSGARENNEKQGGTTSLKDGLESVGLDVNDDLYNWYKDSDYGRKPVVSGGVSHGGGLYTIWNINEAPWSAIPDNVKIKDGYETAVFVLSRLAGEGADAPIYGWCADTDHKDGNYLMLNDDEISVLQGLKAAKDAGKIKKIIVLCNWTNQVMMDFVDNPAYGIDAVLYSGSIGSKGSVAIGNILEGSVNPSGKLSDTFWKNHYLNPVHANYGATGFNTNGGYYKYYGQMYLDANGNPYNTGFDKNSYVVYQEGIYSGYRYTETRYEDKVLGVEGVGEYNYTDVVSYPFGYGNSYTTFEYSAFSAEYNAETDAYDISVTVTNTGSVAGKEAAQIFLQKPYTDYDKQTGVETAAVELVVYDKTEILQPGASEVLNMSVDRRDFAKYDSYGHKTYILEQGDYYLTVGNGAHEAVNNILAAKGKTVTDGMTANGVADLAKKVGNEITQEDLLLYSVAEINAHSEKDENGVAQNYKITNQFDDADLKIFEGGAQYGANAKGGAWTYVTRSNWSGTVKYGYDLTTHAWLNNDVNLYKTQAITDGINWSIMNNPTDEAYPTVGSTSTAWQLIDLKMDEDGNPIPYDDQRWEELLDQLTWNDIVLVLQGGLYNTVEVSNISAPAVNNYDTDLGVWGPYSQYEAGLASKLNDPNKGERPATYVDNGIVAATRNSDLQYEYGVQWGEDCLWAGYHGLYGAGANVHRSPYLGRAYGYFSEDGYLGGKALAQINLGMETKGAYMLAKHCVLNEQETNRCGGASWANEQSIREIYLRVFDVAITEGSVQGVMTSLNRIGTKPAPHHPFLNNVLRKEFGMTGYNITDSWMGYMNQEDLIFAGNDLPLSGNTDISALYKNGSFVEGFGHVAQAARNCAHNVLYTIVHSSAMNGFTSDTRVIRYTPAWQVLFNSFKPVVGTLFGLSVALYVLVEAWIIVDKYVFKKED
ncbi:MAG: glycoside hydrolase family 3 C-terminal domain-containing protein [Clostridia bacterium]|nr:glycoside hydrolase family 3 C-terminal domain-containing protein [Clostridia bacterium]